MTGKTLTHPDTLVKACYLTLVTRKEGSSSYTHGYIWEVSIIMKDRVIGYYYLYDR